MSFLRFLKKDKKHGLNNDELDIPPPPPGMGNSVPVQNSQTSANNPSIGQKPQHELEKDSYSVKKDMMPKPDLNEEMNDFNETISLDRKEKDLFDLDKDSPSDRDFTKIDKRTLQQNFDEKMPGFTENPKASQGQQFVPRPPIKEPERMPFPKPTFFEHEKREDVKKETFLKPHADVDKRIRRKAFREEKKVLERRHDVKRPLFIKLERYKETLRDMNVIRSDLKKSDEILENIIKSKEDKEKQFDKWNESMKDMQKKLIFMEKILFEGD